MAPSNANNINYVHEIGIQLDTCIYHLRAASDAFNKAVDAANNSINACALASNNGDARVSAPSVLWDQLSETRGINVKISKLKDFGDLLCGNDTASVLEDTSRLATNYAVAVSLDSAADKMMQAATVSSVLSNMFRLVSDLSTKYASMKMEKELLNLRQAKPYLMTFCTEPFGEFHRMLVSGDTSNMMHSSSTVEAAKRDQQTRLGSVSSEGLSKANLMMMTPQAQILVSANPKTPQLNNNNNNNNPNEDNDDHDVSEGAHEGGKKKLKKKKGLKKKAAAANNNEDEDEDNASAEARKLSVSNFQPDTGSNVSFGNASSNFQHPPQLTASQKFSFSANGSDCLRFESGIEPSLPTNLRSKYSTLFSNFTNMSSLLASRKTFLPSEGTTISEVNILHDLMTDETQNQNDDNSNTNNNNGEASSSPASAGEIFFDLLEQAVCDAVLDTEIGLELGLGVALNVDQASSSAQVPEWSFPLQTSRGFGIKEIPLSSGGGNRNSNGGGGKNRWISIFGLFKSKSKIGGGGDGPGAVVGNEKFFIRQDAFVRNNTITEVGIELRENFSENSIVLKVAMSYHDNNNNNNNNDQQQQQQDPVGLAFIRLMKDVILAAATQISEEKRKQILEKNGGVLPTKAGSGAHGGGGGKKKKSLKNSNNDILSLDAKSHQERQKLLQEQEQQDKEREEAERKRKEAEANENRGIIREVGSTVFGVVKGIALAPVNAVTSVAGAAASSLKDQQVAMFERNFPQFRGEEVVDLFNCALRDGGPLKQGYLFLLRKRCCFCATVLSAKFTLEWKDIKNLEKQKFGGFFNNSIEISVWNSEETYFLTSFIDRNSALNRIFEFWTQKV